MGKDPRKVMKVLPLLGVELSEYLDQIRDFAREANPTHEQTINALSAHRILVEYALNDYGGTPEHTFMGTIDREGSRKSSVSLARKRLLKLLGLEEK